MSPVQVAGLMFETPLGTFRVLRVNKGRVFFNEEITGGKVAGSLPIPVFQQMVGTAIGTPVRRRKFLERVTDEVLVALRAALPAIAWHRRTPEEIAELDRLKALYQELSHNERRYVVSRARGRKIRIAIGLVLAVVLFLWIGDYSDAYHRGQEALYEMNYLREKAEKNRDRALETAIDEAERDYAE